MQRIFLFGLSACVPHLQTTGGSDTDSLGADWVAPANQWPINRPPVGLVAEGWQPGEVVPDLRLTDQHGDELSLWQFSGRVILFDISTMWCAPCRELAGGTQETGVQFGEDLMYITVLQQNVSSASPSVEDLNTWADLFEITSPVVEDGAAQTADAVIQGQFPAVLLIGRDLRVIQRINPPVDAEVRRAITAAI